MSDTIKINVSAMFATREPYDCSNNAMTLGPDVGRITWANATAVAESADSWLLSPKADAVEAIKGWARSAGAWDREEIEGWNDVESLALLVQNVASELRICLDCDDRELLGDDSVLSAYTSTDWEHESETPMGHYYSEGPTSVSPFETEALICDFYVGC